MSNHDDSSNRREDDRERALPQRGRLWLDHEIRPAQQDGDRGQHPQAWPNAPWRRHGGARRRSGYGNQGPAN